MYTDEKYTSLQNIIKMNTNDFDVNILSKKIVQRHPANNLPKFVEVSYANGRVMMMHYHNNGNVSSKIMRQGNNNGVPRYSCLDVYSKKVLRIHPASNQPKITEIKYSNGRIVQYHTHNNGDLSSRIVNEGN